MTFDPVERQAIIGFDGRVLNAGIDHGGANLLMAEELLDGGDVHAGIEQARGTGVA